jgi:hypothetical protein
MLAMLEGGDGEEPERLEQLDFDRERPLPDYFRAELVAAFAAGLFYFRIEPAEIICVARPAVWVAERRLHRAAGPAVVWPSGARSFFWQGVEVSDWFIERPEMLTLERIADEWNIEARRHMIERFGFARFVREADATLIGEDHCGRLWSARIGRRFIDPIVVVEVENGTREPDGTRRRYFLRVPPTMRSAREAVAWTYGLTPEQYEDVRRT